MKLNKTIDTDYITAFKARDDICIQALRMLRSEIHSLVKDRKSELTDDEIVLVVRTAVKKRYEAAEAYANAGAVDKAARERKEAEILSVYLPAQLDEAELDRLIAQAVKEADAQGVGDLGNVMKVLMPKVAGRSDGKTVNQKVRQALTH
jgi:uncharacterized protein